MAILECLHFFILSTLIPAMHYQCPLPTYVLRAILLSSTKHFKFVLIALGVVMLGLRDTVWPAMEEI